MDRISREASNGNNTLAVGQEKKDGDYLESPNKRFRLLFFSSPLFSNTRYLGIQCMSGGFQVEEQHLRVVWVANPNSPLTDTSGSLRICQEGNLVLNSSNGHNFTINGQDPDLGPSGNSSSSAILLDSGNLILRRGDQVVWQSFDYPTHILLPGMRLGFVSTSKGEVKSRSLTSWVSQQVPIPGSFTLGVNPNNTNQLVLWRRRQVFWRGGTWTNGSHENWNWANWANWPSVTAEEAGLPDALNLTYFSNERVSYFAYIGQVNKSTFSWIYLDPQGLVFVFQVGMTSWNSRKILWCDYYGELPPGCMPLEPSGCGSDIFYQDSGYVADWRYLMNSSLSITDCEEMCRRDCSCTAYASSLPDGSGCKLSSSKKNYYHLEAFYSRLKGLREFYPPTYGVPNNPHKLEPSHANNRRQMWVAVGSGVAVLIILTVVSLQCYLRSRNCHFEGSDRRSGRVTSRKAQSAHELQGEIAIFDNISNVEGKDEELPLFSLSSLEIATNCFSEENKIGQGGFGPVYKGKLVTGQEVAVKRLSRSSGQGLEQFKTEVKLISRLQHRNLVRLFGCCIQGDERILVYEYMHNRSLDYFLFDETRRSLLDWKMRVYIIEGIAQGILYLHKYSRLKIVHRDLKTGNILLDNDMNPKISDFGTARIFEENESRANTKRIVGTYGYMSPEYAMNGQFSVKSDIFSFGVMILEIVSGKKNTGFYHPDRALNLLGYAWDLWKEGRDSEIVDHALIGTCSTSKVNRYIQVGFLCVQENAVDRPTISEIVSMLNNEMIQIPTPKQPAFSAIVGVVDVNKAENPESFSVNNVTISEIEAR